MHIHVFVLGNMVNMNLVMNLGKKTWKRGDVLFFIWFKLTV